MVDAVEDSCVEAFDVGLFTLAVVVDPFVECNVDGVVVVDVKFSSCVVSFS